MSDKPKYSIHICHLNSDEHYMNFTYEQVIEDSVGENSSDNLGDVIVYHLAMLNEDEIDTHNCYLFLVDNQKEIIIKLS